MKIRSASNAHDLVVEYAYVAQFYLLCTFVFVTVLYYFLRFQFDLQVFIPLFQYSVLLLLVPVSLLLWFSHKSVDLNRLDKVVLLFFLYNLGFVGLSWYEHGQGELFYSLKNYIAGFLVYFMVALTLREKWAEPLFIWIVTVFQIVACIYLAEYLQTHLIAPGDVLSESVGHGVFKYTNELDKYAMSLGSENGIAMPWERGSGFIWHRLPGPLAYPNATGLVLAMGLVVAAAMVVQRYALKWAYFLCVLFAATLLVSGARTAIIAAMAGLACLVFYGVRNGKIQPRLLLKIAAFSLAGVLGLALTNVIDVVAMGKIYSVSAMSNTLHIMVNEKEFTTFVEHYSDYLLLGNGFASSTAYLADPHAAVAYGPGKPVVSMDLYFIQVLSTYGIIPSMMFLGLLVYALIRTYQDLRDQGAFDRPVMLLYLSAAGVLVAGLVSTAHSQSLATPQILPVVMAMVALLSKMVSKTRSKPDSVPEQDVI